MSPSGDPTDDLQIRFDYKGNGQHDFDDASARYVLRIALPTGGFGIVHVASMGAHWNFRKAFTLFDPLKTVADHSLMLLNNRTMVEAVDLYLAEAHVSVKDFSNLAKCPVPGWMPKDLGNWKYTVILWFRSSLAERNITCMGTSSCLQKRGHLWR